MIRRSMLGRIKGILVILSQITFLTEYCSAGDMPIITSSITHGMMIESSSWGSTMNVFTWDQRHFNSLPAPLTLPQSVNSMETRLTPPLYTFADHPENISVHLDPLISYAVDVLAEMSNQDYLARRDYFSHYPVFLKATAGLRLLTEEKRNTLLSAVSNYLGDASKNPFYFESSYARVLSGEEEAAFAWTTINYLSGVLKMNQVGFGQVDAKTSYGALDLGGEAASIAFYLPKQDIAASLFKLSFGDSKHWNIYAHSEMWFGVTTAAERRRWNLIASNNELQPVDLLGTIPSTLMQSFDNKIEIIDECLPKGFGEAVTIAEMNFNFVSPPHGGNWTRCREQTTQLLNKQLNSFCLYEHHMACSFSGAYQPTLPPQSSGEGKFFGFQGYADLFEILRLPPTALLSDIEREGSYVCSLSYDDILNMYNTSEISLSANKWSIDQYCFFSAYALSLLHEGYGFSMDHQLTCQHVLNGGQVGWALGSMIYEINALPWEYTGEQCWMLFGVMLTILALILGLFLYNNIHAICSHGSKVRTMTHDPIIEILASSASLMKLNLSRQELSHFNNSYAELEHALGVDDSSYNLMRRLKSFRGRMSTI